MGQADQRRAEVAGRLGHGGVADDDPPQLVAMGQRPPQREDPAPVVTDRDDRSGDSHGLGEVTEVGDPLRDRALGVEPLGEPHPEVVGCHHAPTCGRRGDQSPPQVGPRRVAVHAQQGPVDGLHPVVEDVPLPLAPLGIGGADRPRPRRVQPGEVVGHGMARRPLRSPADLDDAGVEPGADPHQEDPVARAEGVGLVGEREGHGGRPDVAELGEAARDVLGVDLEPFADGVGVDLRDLVQEVATDPVVPAELAGGLVPETRTRARGRRRAGPSGRSSWCRCRRRRARGAAWRRDSPRRPARGPRGAGRHAPGPSPPHPSPGSGRRTRT